MSNLIPNRSDYKDLLCYKKAEAIFDLTNLFTEALLPEEEPKNDDEVQAELPF